jgi:LmbE family N-acetylglucosaminyl deacetylase
MKFTALDYLIAGILSYYLIKGLIFLFMWTTLGMMADKGKKTKAKQLEDRKEAIRRKREIRENTKS